MASFLYRFLYLLIGLSPMSIGIFCIGKDSLIDILYGVSYGIGACVLALILFNLYSGRLIGSLEGVKVKPNHIQRKREGLSGYFLAYVLPLILTEPAEKWILLAVVILLAFTGLKTKALGYNPVAELVGYNFYDVQDGSGITLLVIAKSSPQELLQGFRGVTLTEDFIVEK